MDEIKDEELIRRFRAGDDVALATLFTRYEAILGARIRRRLPVAVQRKVGISDVVQETRIVAFARREDFDGRGEGAFRKWVLGIADNKARAAVERFGGVAKRNVFSEVSQSHRAETGQMAGRSPSPSQVAMGDELKQLARRAMAELPEDYRLVLLLAKEQQLTMREIAQHMGRSRDAVKKLYGRALYRYTEDFDRLWGGADG